MIAVTPSVPSTATIETALTGQSGQATESPPGGSALAGFGVPQWGPDVAELVERGPEGKVADRLLKGMMSAGHGLEALSFYLGLEENELRDRVAALGLDQPTEKRLRRSGAANPWSLHDTRLFMALWLDNVSAASMAEAFGRSRRSIHGKRRWLGLPVRDRKWLADRPVQECRGTDLPWKPDFDVGEILARLMRPRPGKGFRIDEVEPVAPAPPPPVKWELGRDKEKDRRFSILGFAGLRSPAIAERMFVEFGVRLTKSAVDNRLSRLQIVRQRRDMTDEYDPEEVERRAEEAMRRLGATLRECMGLGRSFWFYRTIGGNRTTCREFDAKKYEKRKAERSCGAVMGMA